MHAISDSTFQILYDVESTYDATTREQVEIILDRLHAEAAHETPRLVVIQHLGSDYDLMLGIGCDTSLIHWNKRDGEPPYWSSVGDTEATGILAFNYMGSYTEIPLKNTVPYSLARQAVREFTLDGKRPSCVEWEID